MISLTIIFLHHNIRSFSLNVSTDFRFARTHNDITLRSTTKIPPQNSEQKIHPWAFCAGRNLVTSPIDILSVQALGLSSQILCFMMHVEDHSIMEQVVVEAGQCRFFTTTFHCIMPGTSMSTFKVPTLSFLAKPKRIDSETRTTHQI